MRVRKIVVGLSAVIAVAGIAACSSGAAGSSAGPQVAANLAGQTTTPVTTTPVPVTTTVPKTTVAPPATTKAPVVQAPVTHPAVAAAQVPVAHTAALVSGTPCSAAASACVDLARHEAWLMSGGKVVYGPVPIMPGLPAFPTPTGTFHVLFKNAHYFSREFQAPMPDSVFFYPGDAFHVGSLHVYSHGCIHLSWTAAATFFRDLSVGDEVQVIR